MGEQYFIILLDDCNEDLKHRFNPNVLFECGVISTISDAKLTFIARENTNIPFDIGGNIRIVRIPANLFSCISDHFNDESFNADTIDLGCVSEIRRFKTDVKSSFKASDNPFIRDYELEFLAQYGFSSLIQFLKKIGIEDSLALDSGTVKYIDGEEEAFKALTQAVKKAKRSLRTTRFARQTIIDNMPCHEEFMNALKIASYKVTKFDRIICINTKEKWLDVLTALGEFCPQTTTIYLRKEQFTIKFELVIIDEEVSFIHFYLWNCQEMCSQRIPKICNRQVSGGMVSQPG